MDLVQDQTILATAVPKISDEFKALEDIAWWASAYMLTVSYPSMERLVKGGSQANGGFSRCAVSNCCTERCTNSSV